MQIPLYDKPGVPDHLSEVSKRPPLHYLEGRVTVGCCWRQQGVMRPDLDYSFVCLQIIPFFLHGQPGPFPAGKPTGNGNGVAASTPTCSGRRQNAKPVQLHLHIGQNRKPETEMMAPQSPRDRKWNRWLFLTSFCRQTLPENCNLGYWPDISYCK